ncbi:unnamed protein product [Caenorhabditis auriculariae]|uniref:PLAT domain-containing protein n=1 Tax=Caenorhabditis auriculariae TaxID=2777116 RepID=A0A8S1HWE6_9PELO|nr:unnamed protein product [Caenorhabditis auriculariae]
MTPASTTSFSKTPTSETPTSTDPSLSTSSTVTSLETSATIISTPNTVTAVTTTLSSSSSSSFSTAATITEGTANASEKSTNFVTIVTPDLPSTTNPIESSTKMPSTTSLSEQTENTATGETKATDIPYDFELSIRSWEMTVSWAENFSINATPNKNLFKNMSYTCRQPPAEFLPASESTCFQKDGVKVSWMSDVQPTEARLLFVSPGLFEINITVKNPNTPETASHVLTVTVLGTSTTSTNATKEAPTTKKATESTASGAKNTEFETTNFPTGTSKKSGASLSSTSTKFSTRGGSTNFSNQVSNASITEKARPTPTKLITLATMPPLTAEEEAAIEKQKEDLKNSLANILNSSSSYPPISNGSSLVQSISSLPPQELVDVAQSLLSNQLDIAGMSNVEVLTMLKDNIAKTNSQLADQVTKVIEQLSKVNMTSPQSMNSVLSVLDSALQGCMVYSIGVTSTGDVNGQYVVIYGSIQASGYTVVTPRSMMTVYGNTIYVTGDTRGAYVQQDGDDVMVTMDDKMMTLAGTFDTRSVSVEAGTFEMTTLIDDNAVARLEGVAETAGETDVYPSTFATAWNISYDQFGAKQQSQVNVSVNNWIKVTRATLSLIVDSKTIALLQATKSTAALKLDIDVVFDSTSFKITLGEGKAKFIQVTNSSAILSYDNCTASVTPGDPDAEDIKMYLVEPYVIENIDLSVFQDQSQGTVDLPLKAAGNDPMGLVIAYPVRHRVFVFAQNALLFTRRFKRDFHLWTFMEFSENQKMLITGGVVFRNGTNGFVIKYGKVSTQGEITGTQLAITPQSLMNQKSQKMIGDILNNTQQYLQNNGMEMTDEQLDEAATTLLDISTSLTSSVMAALNNPLSSDLLANLQYEQANYDDIFNVLPPAGGRIRYVEEYSPDEWAAEATRIAQQSIAKKLAAQMASTLDTLENVLAARAVASGNIPYVYAQNSSGTGMYIEIDYPSSLFSRTQRCSEWLVQFPSSSSKLNSPKITDVSPIQLGLVCYDSNPYAYVDNFKLLISSGALEAHLKDLNQNIIEIENATEPITFEGKGLDERTESTQIVASDLNSYQILDLHTFQTTSWNSSLQLEIVPSLYLFDVDMPHPVLFLAFQRLPGPLPQDHDVRFQLKRANEISTIFVPAEQLLNQTSLFYFGVGSRTDTVNESLANYGTVDDSQWTFKRKIDFDYEIRAYTKGCYYYLSTADRFDNEGLSPMYLAGDQIVKCSTNHLTLFSVGVFAPEIPADFKYEYIQQKLPKNVGVVVCVMFCIFLYMSGMLCAVIFETRDESKGRLRFLKDNYPADGYMYILAVETGYRMFATTDSQSDQDEEWGQPFTWGTTSRFLMTTALPLGDLTYIRLWIEEAGSEHRESWFCNRIIVKDLQTKQVSIFPVNNWLGTTNGDGQTERLSQVQKKQKFLDEAMSPHILAQTIAWCAAFTGGGMLWRSRVQRYDYICNIFAALIILCIINLVIVKMEKFENNVFYAQTLFGFSFAVKDIIVGVVLGFVLTSLASIHVWIRANCRSNEEQRLLKFYKARHTGSPKTGTLPWGLGLISQSVSMMIGFFGILFVISAGMRLSEDPSQAFLRRFIFMLFAWILLFEPLKGMIVAAIMIKRNKGYKICTNLEELLLNVQPPDTFQRTTSGHTEKGVGKTIADILKLRDTDDRRMRDEQLFETVRDVICLFASLFILIGLTFFCRDRQGYYYQKQVRNLLNVDMDEYGDGSFMAITKPSDFWDWAEKDLTKALRASWYDEKPAYNMRGFLNDKVSRAMGIGTIRQVRTKPDACEIAPEFADYFNSCEKDFSSKTEEKTLQMQPGWTKFEGNENDTRDEYTYKTQENLMTGTIQGSVGRYGGGGYTVSLGGTGSQLAASFQQLKDENWIDENTRAVIVEFSVYNAQVNYFAVVQLLIERPSEGFIYPTGWIETVRLIKSEGSSGNIVVTFEFLYVVFALFTFIKEVLFFVYSRYKVLSTASKKKSVLGFLENLIITNCSPWQVMDLLIGILALTSVIAYWLRQIYTNEAVEMFLATNGNSYINLSKQRDTELTFNYCLAGVVFFVSCKMIRILRFNRRIGVLADTLDNACSDMLSFGVAFVVICVSFNCTLYHLLWDKLDGYKSVVTTFETTLAGMLGKFVIADLFTISKLGSVVFVIFMFGATTILLNIYVMIIMYEFEQIIRKIGMNEAKDNPPKFIPDSMKDFRNINKLLAKMNMLHHRVMTMRDLADLNIGLLDKKTFDSDYDILRAFHS